MRRTLNVEIRFKKLKHKPKQQFYSLTDSALASHHRLDVVGFEWDMAHQVDEAILGDQDVILEANSEVFFPDINARLDGEDMSGLDGFMPVTDIVHVKSNEV